MTGFAAVRPRFSGLGRATGLLLGTAALAASLSAAQADERSRIRIVGSEKVFPLAVAAGEAFSQKTRFLTPLVEANGSDRGFALFCAGKGVQHPDIATSDRRMTRAEVSQCRRRGITVSEIKIGHRAVVLAKSRRGQPLSLTGQQIFLALARQVPVDGKPAENPYRLWSDIDFTLPVTEIEAFGPALNNPKRIAFTELALAPVAAKLFRIKADDRAGRREFAQLRRDGVFRALPNEPDRLLQRFEQRPEALGIVGFTFLQQNADRLQGIAVDGVVPTAESIADGSYGPSSPLYLYIKRENLRVIPGVADYIAEISGTEAAGQGGYLVPRGLIPLPPEERAALSGAASRLAPLRP